MRLEANPAKRLGNNAVHDWCEQEMVKGILERFSKPNFGSIRRFRMMTGLEIENWIENRGWTIRKFRSTRARTESNFRFGLTSCRSQNLPTEVRSLPCQVFDSFSLVTLSSSHHASHLRGFIRSLTRPNWSFHSTRLTMNFFYFGRRFSAGTWPSSVNEWARGVGHGITSDRGLGSESSKNIDPGEMLQAGLRDGRRPRCPLSLGNGPRPLPKPRDEEYM